MEVRANVTGTGAWLAMMGALQGGCQCYSGAGKGVCVRGSSLGGAASRPTNIAVVSGVPVLKVNGNNLRRSTNRRPTHRKAHGMRWRFMAFGFWYPHLINYANVPVVNGG